MNRAMQETLALAVSAAGFAMLGWGSHRFSAPEPEGTGGSKEEGIRFCRPTVGELAEELGAGLVGRKMAYLTVAGLGLVVGVGGFLFLIRGRDQA
jgi:hypothetical protein